MMIDGTVFVVDDDEGVRNSLRLLFTSVGHDVQTFSGAREFLNEFNADHPGCLVLDIRMPGMSGLELQRHLKRESIDLPVIIITGHGDVPIAVRAMKEGAMEFMEKPFSKQILLEHVRTALKRNIDARIEGEQRNEFRQRARTLTERERQVMDLVVAGHLSKQIAADLGISKKTVDVHRARVMSKMKAQSLPELVRLAMALRNS